MKIRSGFVTNSSSSSFIVMYNEGEKFSIPEEEKERIIDILMEEAIEKYICDISSIDELNQYYTYELGYKSVEAILSDKYEKDEYNKIKAEIESGKRVRIIRHWTDDEDLAMLGHSLACDIILALGKKDGITVIGDGMI